jgi:hypothetical protein
MLVANFVGFAVVAGGLYQGLPGASMKIAMRRTNAELEELPTILLDDQND